MKNLQWLVFFCCMGLSIAAAAAAPGDDLRPLDCMIEPHTTVDLSFSVEGVVETISVDRSDFVEAGQALARLESTVEQATVDQASVQAAMEGEILARQATLRFASSNLARVRESYANRSASINDKEQAETELTLARMELKKAEESRQVAVQNLRRAEAVLDRRTLKSPISGVVVERFIPPGEFVKEQPVLKIAQLDPLRVEVIAPAGMFGRIRPGMMAEILPESPIEGSHPARVTVVDRLIDAGSGTFGIRLELPNSDHRLPGGLRCRVKFPAAEVAADSGLVPINPAGGDRRDQRSVPQVAKKVMREPAPAARSRPSPNPSLSGSGKIALIQRYDLPESPVDTRESLPDVAYEPSSPIVAQVARLEQTGSIPETPAAKAPPVLPETRKKPLPAVAAGPVSKPAETAATKDPEVPELTAVSGDRSMPPTTPSKVERMVAAKNSTPPALASKHRRPQPLGKGCAVLGPFSTRQQIALAHTELDSGEWNLVERRYKNIELDGYSVFAPPQPSSEAQQALLERLSGQQVIDFIVLKRGRYKGRVALGHFEQRARAEKHRDIIRDMGFDAQVETRFRTRVGHWLEMKPAPLPTDANRIVERMEATWPGLDLDLNDCSGDRAPLSSKKIVKR